MTPIRPWRSALVAAGISMAVGFIGFHAPGASSTTRMLGGFVLGTALAFLAFAITLAVQLIRRRRQG